MQEFPPLKKVLYFARKRHSYAIAFCRYATMGVTNSLSLMLPNSCVPSVASEQSSSGKFGRTYRSEADLFLRSFGSNLIIGLAQKFGRTKNFIAPVAIINYEF
jgi:hypothetical protein